MELVNDLLMPLSSLLCCLSNHIKHVHSDDPTSNGKYISYKVSLRRFWRCSVYLMQPFDRRIYRYLTRLTPQNLRMKPTPLLNQKNLQKLKHIRLNMLSSCSTLILKRTMKLSLQRKDLKSYVPMPTFLLMEYFLLFWHGKWRPKRWGGSRRTSG